VADISTEERALVVRFDARYRDDHQTRRENPIRIGIAAIEIGHRAVHRRQHAVRNDGWSGDGDDLWSGCERVGHAARSDPSL